jgi:hypothetical protein
MAKLKHLARGSIKVCVFLSVNPRKNPRAFAFLEQYAEHPRFSRAIVQALELGIKDVTSTESDDINLAGLLEEI